MSMRTRRRLLSGKRDWGEHFNSSDRIDDDARGRRLQNSAAGGGEKLRPFVPGAIVQGVAKRLVGGSNSEGRTGHAEAEIIKMSLAVASPSGLDIGAKCGEPWMRDRNGILARNSQYDDAVVCEGERADTV